MAGKLNNEQTQQFLKAIIFPDSKRSITKDILMRIDFAKLYNLHSFEPVQKELNSIESEGWEAFGNMINKSEKNSQMTLF